MTPEEGLGGGVLGVDELDAQFVVSSLVSSPVSSLVSGLVVGGVGWGQVGAGGVGKVVQGAELVVEGGRA